MTRYVSANTLGELHKLLGKLLEELSPDTPVVKASRFADFSQNIELQILTAKPLNDGLEGYYKEDKDGIPAIKIGYGG